MKCQNDNVCISFFKFLLPLLLTPPRRLCFRWRLYVGLLARLVKILHRFSQNLAVIQVMLR